LVRADTITSRGESIVVYSRMSSSLTGLVRVKQAARLERRQASAHALCVGLVARKRRMAQNARRERARRAVCMMVDLWESWDEGLV
jgi:hypothetical protein